MSRYLLLLVAIFVIHATTLAGQEDKQKASIMVLPSDNLMKRLGYLEYKTIQGVDYPVRDYQKALIEDGDLKFVISGIKESFAERGYLLEDLEQSLKSFQNEQSLDNLENFDFDSRAHALKTARPDIILDLTYDHRSDGMTNKFIFNIEAVDAYTLKGISSASHPGIETINNNIPELMVEQLELNIHNLQDLINLHFSDLKENGREIALRIISEDGAVSDFRKNRICTTDDEKLLPVSRWISEWLKANTASGYGKRVLNSAKELKYNHIRIALTDDDGYPISASDWSYSLIEALEDNCQSLLVIDYSSGLGEAFLVITP